MRKQEVGAAPRDGVHHTNTGPLTATARQRVHALSIAARLKEPGSNPAEDLGHTRVLKEKLTGDVRQDFVHSCRRV